MTEPDRSASQDQQDLASQDPQDLSSGDPRATRGDPPPLHEDDDRPVADRPTGRRRPDRGAVATFLLLGIMLVSGLVAAWMATPRPDEDSLARPGDADVVIAVGRPSSWDPAEIADSTSAQILAQVFDGLTTLEVDGSVSPALAESWEVSDDGRRIDFRLRDGLTFSDGEPLDAEDVRRSWLRVIDPQRPSPLSSLLDDVAGAAAFARGEAEADEVGIHADGRTLRVDLARPAAYFPSVVAVPTLAVVPEDVGEQVRGPRDERGFVASGAFIPEATAPGELRLQANPTWWGGRPRLERISVRTDLGGRSEVDVFEDEAVDWTAISPTDASWIRYDQRLGPQLREGDDLVLELLGFDTSRPPFDDAAVRRAVALAVDWRRLSALSGATEPVTSLLPPGMPGRDDGDDLLPHDPEAARAELAAAGHAGGAGIEPVTLATYGVGPVEGIAHEIEQELGIDVTVELWPFDDHAALVDRDPPHLWTMAWSADYPHPHDVLGLLLRSGSSANDGRWSDTRFDALIDAAAATDDAAEQARLYSEAGSIVGEEAPIIPLGYGSSWALSREGLLGAGISGVGLMRFADLAWDE